MKLSSHRISIRSLQQTDSEALYSLRIKNKEFFRPFEPIRSPEDFSMTKVVEQIESSIRNFDQGTAYSFGIFLNETEKLIGRVNLSNVARGAWQNATIGYFLDEEQNGKGYMTEAVQLAVTFAFENASLHRVQGAVMPRNIGSIKVLEKAGFRYEGLSRNYLQINGVWEDHNMYAITFEDYQAVK